MGMTVQPSEGPGSALTHVKEYSDAEHAFLHVPVTGLPSGAEMAPSTPTLPPLGTSHISKVGRAVQPGLCACRHAPASLSAASSAPPF